ncbi:MAG: two-component regulator propeller domain-containing protein, partial [Bacteroidota bacterium]
ITSEDGLSDNQVTCVLRDKSGFMWIGTKDGLNRYDGREFYTFRHFENDSTSLCGNNISCLTQDADSLLWIGTASTGFCSYDFRTGKFTSYNKRNTPLNSNSINTIAFDKNRNQLWLGLNNAGLQLFDLKTKKFPTTENLISLNTYLDIVVRDTIPYFAGIGESLKRLGKIGKHRGIVTESGSTINKIYIASDHYLWCGAWDNGLHEFDNSTKKLNTFYFDGTDKLNISGNEIISITEDADKILWCGTKASGILFFDLKTKTFVNKYRFSQPVTSRINCIYKDDFNRIWVGTETGLFIYDPLKNQFNVVTLPFPQGITMCRTYDRIITQSGKEYIATACGLFYKTPSDSNYTFREIIYKNEKLQVTSIFSDYKSRIFIGTNKTIFELDTLTLGFHTMKVNSKVQSDYFFSTKSSRVNAISQLAIKGDTAIVASFYGHYITLIHPERQNILQLRGKRKLPGDVLDNLTRRLFIDSKNNLWVCGASKGISLVMFDDTMNLNNFIFQDTAFIISCYDWKYWKNKKQNDIAAITDVYDIAENKDGSYWLTTQGWGLIKFFPENDTTPFVSYPGSFKSLQGLVKTNDENLWIISSTGLLNYDEKNNRYIRYDKSDGVPEGLSGYFFHDGSSNLTAGFDGGYISFDPAAVLKDAEKPLVKISRLWVMDAASDSLLFSKLHLSYDKNFLKFYVSANAFSNNDQITFMYYLQGIDNNWRNNQSNPLVTYTNLPPGDFILKVKVVNSDGIESDVISLPVIITPPFYRTIYFYSAVVLALAGSIYIIYRYRIKQIFKMQEVRNKIARDLHDDIGSTLGSIHLYSQIAASKLKGKKPEEVKSILEKIESSSSEIIDKTGDAVWAVKASNDSLKNLVLRIESYAASLLGIAGIPFTINYDEQILETKLEMTQRKNIFLIYKEALHNIMKYADCTEVTITIGKKANRMQIIINDNGKGFTMNGINPYNGNGIKNMKSRAEEINGSFMITSQNGKGTSVEIIV